MRHKLNGIWREYTWSQCYQKVRLTALGLSGIGLERGDTVAILGHSSPEWLWCELAVQAAGGIVVGLHPVGDVETTKEIMARVEARMVFAQDQEQVYKVLESKSGLPSLRRIVYWNQRGLRRYSAPILMSLDELVSVGESRAPSQPGEFERSLTGGSSDDVAMVFLSHGDGGDAEIRTATHGFLLSSARAALALNPVRADDEYVSSMSPSSFFEQVLGIGVSLLTGQRLNFPERPDTGPMDFREISPHVVMYPTTTWETMACAIGRNMEDSRYLKRVLYKWSLLASHGSADGGDRSGRVGLFRRVLNRIADILLVRPLRDRHGLNRARIAYAVGGTIAEEASVLFRALGVSVEQLFGSWEKGVSSVSPPHEVRIE